MILDNDKAKPRTVTVETVCPTSEFSARFIEGMLARMAMSFFKYGRVADAYPQRIDAIASLKQRLDLYAETGNTEYLMDAANFAMIEYMHPKHPDAHFEATDSDQSPGRVGVNGSAGQQPNDAFLWKM